jgi:integrase
MPRKSKGPRLYLRQRAGRVAQYVIRDGEIEHSTGFGAADIREAEKVFAQYLAKKFEPRLDHKDLRSLSIAEVLAFYGAEIAPNHSSPQLAGFHIKTLLDFWGDKMVSEISGRSCRAYVAWRTEQVGKHGRPISESTARRELVTLQAAINAWGKEAGMSGMPAVTLPSESSRRERVLERWEVAALLWSSLGFKPVAYDLQTRRPIKWVRSTVPAPHLARFILIALDTGTRHGAVLGLQWESNPGGGHVDVARGLIYRRGSSEKETRKRRPPVNASRRLLNHLRRWRAQDGISGVLYIVNWRGQKIKKERRAWARVVEGAGLDLTVTPHVLRHTCATWALWEGRSVWEVAERLGASATVIDNTYGHHRNAVMDTGANLGRKTKARG